MLNRESGTVDLNDWDKAGEDLGPRGSLPWLAELAHQAFDRSAVPEALQSLEAAEARVDTALAQLADLRDALAEAREAMQNGDGESSSRTRHTGPSDLRHRPVSDRRLSSPRMAGARCTTSSVAASRCALMAPVAPKSPRVVALGGRSIRRARRRLIPSLSCQSPSGAPRQSLEHAAA